MHEILDPVLVVKIGTNTLMNKTEDGSERLDEAAFARIGRQVINLQEDGFHVVMVSSAAITAGMVETGLQSRPSKDTAMPHLQRLASIGWRHVLNAWDTALPGKTIGELLLTGHELDLASEREEVLRVTHTLLSHGDIAIANENDAIAHDEIAFGDNDVLAATFAARLRQSCLFGNDVRLVLLSDVDGVYADKDNPGSIVRSIYNIETYAHLAGGAGSANGTGGMATKFRAASIAARHGVDMWIANGRTENILQQTLNGHTGTHFVSCPGTSVQLSDKSAIFKG